MPYIHSSVRAQSVSFQSYLFFLLKKQSDQGRNLAPMCSLFTFLKQLELDQAIVGRLESCSCGLLGLSSAAFSGTLDANRLKSSNWD